MVMNQLLTPTQNQLLRLHQGIVLHAMVRAGSPLPGGLGMLP